ncbi:MAG: hypothetical protein K8J08_21085 [Thermoanaerobaculia bacterium]|nr:hypothetical protein [Thermoanaerobaculia bacterium]
MSELEKIPMTVVAPLASNYSIVVSIAGKWIPTPKGEANSYWILVIDRSSLETKYNVLWTDPDKAPPIPSDLDDPQYMLVVLTWALKTPNVPSGAFYDFLVDNGAGAGLKTIVQANTQIGCGTFVAVAYALVGQLGKGRPTSYLGIEGSIVIGESAGLFLPLELVPAEIDGTVTYTPSRLT